MPDRTEAPRPLVIGLGADARSDDGIGLEVVRALRRDPTLAADVVEGPGDLWQLLDLWGGRPIVVVIDAVRSGAPPGTISRWDGPEAARLPSGFAVSTHGFSLPDVLHLSAFLGRLPARLIVFGVEARAFGPGTDRSPEVRAAVPEVCRRVLHELVGPRTPFRDPEVPYA